MRKSGEGRRGGGGVTEEDKEWRRRRWRSYFSRLRDTHAEKPVTLA